MLRNDEQNILQKELTTVTDWILKKYEMNRVPEDRKLKTLLDGYTKEKMMDLSDENGFEAKGKWKKAELVDYMANAILEDLEERLLILGKERLELLEKNEQGFSTDSSEFFAFYIEVFTAATRMGILYSFEGDGEIVSYVPEEVAEKMGEVLADFSQLEKKYAEKIRFWKEVEKLMHAGVTLYGVMSKGTVYDLWEVYKPKTKKIDIEERMSLMHSIYHYVPLIAMRNNFYIIREHFIGTDMLASEEEVERSYENLPPRSELDSYQPTKADLKQFIKYSFDRRSAAYKKMKQFVSQQDLNIPFKNIMSYIETNIQLGKSFSALMDDIKQMNMLQFRRFKDFEKFATYYVDLNNHSRLWELRGHTPTEARKIMQ